MFSKNHLKTLTPTQRLTYMALFVALALLLGAVPSPPPTHGFFKLVALPLILSGLILGPKAGFWVGALSDILGYFLYPSGPYFPLFTLTQALTGALPAWFLGGSGNGAPSWRRLCAAIACSQGLTKLILVPLGYHLLYQPNPSLLLSWITIASASLPTQLLHVPLYASLCGWVLRAQAQVEGRESTSPFPAPASTP